MIRPLTKLIYHLVIVLSLTILSFLRLHLRIKTLDIISVIIDYTGKLVR